MKARSAQETPGRDDMARVFTSSSRLTDCRLRSKVCLKSDLSGFVARAFVGEPASPCSHFPFVRLVSDRVGTPCFLDSTIAGVLRLVLGVHFPF